MNTNSINKSLWLRIATIFMMVVLVLTAMPIQPAYAATAGFSAPSIYTSSTLTNAANAYVSDNVYVQTNGNNRSAVYGNFGFSLPAGSTINLVEVHVEGHGNKNWKVAVSKNNGVSYSAFTTITNTISDTITVTGGPGTLWGLTGWTVDSLSNANFKVKIASAGGSSSNVAYLDQLMVRVTYTPVSAAPTTLVITAPSAGTYGGSVNLTATLTSNGIPLSGKTISFSLDGFSRVPPVTTDNNGVATLSNVTLTTGLASTWLNVGSYIVGAAFEGDGNYAYSTDTDTQVVNPRPVTVTADPKNKIYGSNDPALTYQITSGSLVGSDSFSGALTRVAGEDAGTHAITQGTLAISSNYAITYNSNNLTITPLDLTVTADNKSVHTNDPNPIFTFSTSRFVGSDTFLINPNCSALGPNPHTVAGTYAIICDGADAGDNYTISYINGILTVTDKIILTVTADNKAITYGDADPQFTFAYSGFVDGDDPSVIDTPPTCSVSEPHTNVGSYPSITCSDGSDDKYEFSYTSGTLTVSPLDITVTADSQSKTYGAVDPALTYTFAPSLIGVDTFSGALARNAGENVGVYAINKGSLTLGGNYTITYVSANLTINKASLMVTADDQIIGIGVADPLFTFKYDGLISGDDSSAINTPPTCGVSGAHTALGTYPIICSGGLDNNYLFTYVDGTLTVIQNQVNVLIGAADQGGTYTVGNQGLRASYPAVNDGPVKIASTTGIQIVAAERVIYTVNGTRTSFTEMMALPENQLDDTYWLPWYNNVDLDTQLRFGNVSGVTATVHVFIGGVEMTSGCASTPSTPYPYVLTAGASIRVSCAGINNGPVQIVSDENIVAAERVIYKVNGTNTSFSELMALPNGQLDDTYWLPWYNNVDLDTQLRFGNVSGTTATVHVFIGGVEMTSGCTSTPNQAYPYVLTNGSSLRVSCAGINNGPVQIVSDEHIVAAERVIYKVNGVNTSFSEMMALPNSQLNTIYWLPWYNNVDLDTQLRFGNVSGVTATVRVYIGGVEMTSGCTVNGVSSNSPYTLANGASLRVSCIGINNGPVKIESTGNIVAAERVIYNVNGTNTSFSEMMALPNSQLDMAYWLPWYNNVDLDTQLRFGIILP